MSSDSVYLLHALNLAKKGRFTTSPNPNVGCVIVSNNKIVGEGYHICAGSPHAEVNALNVAGSNARGSIVYINLEPCNYYGRTPPCTVALLNAGVSKVVVSMLDPNPRVMSYGLRDLIKSGIKIKYNMMKSSAESINKGFIKRMRFGLPWVRLKLAMSLDGRTAMRNGDSKWITSASSRQDVQILRAESDVILSTATTVLTDNSRLNVRWSDLPKKVREIYNIKYFKQPIKVIIDTANKITPTCRIFQGINNQVWLARLYKDNYLWSSQVKQLLLPYVYRDGIKRLNLFSLMQCLANREINNVLVEAGANLSGALLSSGLVDELIIYQTPKLFGADAKPLCIFPQVNSIRHLNDAISFRLLNIQQFGSDMRLVFVPKKT